MTVKTESVHTGEFLISEGNNSISRENVKLLANKSYVVGEVLTKTSDGYYKAYDLTSSGAAGVIFADVESGDNDGQGLAIVRLAEVKAALLVWPENLSEDDIDKAIDELAAHDIVVRS
ncbi:head decoration protein [Endozoicomonas sp. Mp262]|uniref:head decoration protein n=1 Tax=Endozoicomonas sp. Mp262 TaxID=2919499 RepID=UPI0021D98581